MAGGDLNVGFTPRPPHIGPMAWDSPRGVEAKLREAEVLSILVGYDLIASNTWGEGPNQAWRTMHHSPTKTDWIRD